MTKLEIENKIKEELIKYGIDPVGIKLDTRFNYDLGLDSLDFAELILNMEIAFDLSIIVDQVDSPVNTVNDLIYTISELSKNKLENLVS